MDTITVATARTPEAVGKKVRLRGWVRTRRDSKGGFSFIELNENMYEGPMLKGGSEFSIAQHSVTNALKPGTWNHVAITLDKNSYTARVNGKVIGQKKSSELANWGKQPASLEFGNFDGYIDEIAVLCKTAPAAGNTAGEQKGTETSR